jgi:hypothetical protein
MQIKKKITLPILLVQPQHTFKFGGFFVQNKITNIIFLKDYKIGLKLYVDSHQNDPVKLRYFKEFKANGLEELIDEHDYVLKVSGKTPLNITLISIYPVDFYSKSNNGSN